VLDATGEDLCLLLAEFTHKVTIEINFAMGVENKATGD